MPGQSSQACADCVNLSAMPGIHVLAALKHRKTGWRGKASGSDAVLRTAMPGHDEKANLFQVVRSGPKVLGGFSVGLLGGLYCEPSMVWAASHALFLKRLRNEEAICRRSFRSTESRGSNRAYLSILRRNSSSCEWV